MHPTLDQHPQDGARILREEGWPGVIEAVLSHPAEHLDMPRDTPLQKTLFACDELAGFVHACGLVRPDGIETLEPKSVKKKLKQPSFAAGVHRDEVYAGAELIGLELDSDHIRNVVTAMRPIAGSAGPADQAAWPSCRCATAAAGGRRGDRPDLQRGDHRRPAGRLRDARADGGGRRSLARRGFPSWSWRTTAAPVLAWASAPPYRAHREAYRGVGDFSVYVADEARGRGAGRLAMEALAAEARARGFWSSSSRIFPENEASLALCRSLGFREVGVYQRRAARRRLAGCGNRRASARRRLGREQADLDALGERLQVAWVERLDAADARHGLHEPARAHEDRRHRELRADELET